jgi:TP901 family phage tail tape measure protein
MALGAREVLLILRARDEASRVLGAFGRTFGTLSGAAAAAAKKNMLVGGTMMAVGAGIATVGVKGVEFFNNATNAAIAYDQQAAKTLTQVDQQGKSLERIKDIGREVAAVIPVPFEEVQTSLYDIFSSMDVTVEDSKKLLTSFAKAAVAGQVDIQDASRATIGIMNAYHMKISDVNDVNDTMFQLVRKGVGTYAEFAGAIGRATPSAAKAGGTFKDLAGMMAFSTRNGLSAAMAATSAARAYDAISNPKTLKNFDNFGKVVETTIGKERARQLGITGDAIVHLTDKAGNFRSMANIMTDLGKSLNGLNESERAGVLKNLFLGSGGTIQAMRFFTLATQNFDELNQRTKEMKNAAGVMQGAYDIMFKQPQTQVQLLKNKYAVLRTEIGDQLLPTKIKLLQTGIKLLDMWNNLDPGIRKIIVQFAALASAVAVVVGVVTAVVGAIIFMQAGLALAGTTIGAVLLPVAVALAAIVAVIALVTIVIMKWDVIAPFVTNVWNKVRDVTVSAWDAVYAAVAPKVIAVWNFLVAVWGKIEPYVIGLWNAIRASSVTVWRAVTTAVTVGANAVWHAITSAVAKIRATWSAFWNSNFAKLVRDVLGIVYELFRINFQLMYAVVNTYIRLISRVVQVGLSILVPIFTHTVAMLLTIWKVFWLTLTTIMRPILSALKGDIQGAWSLIVDVTRVAWIAVKAAIIDPITSVAGAVGGLLSNVLGVLNNFLGKVDAVASKIRGALKKINPAQHFSPSVNEQTHAGLVDLRRIVVSELDKLHSDADARATKIRAAMRRGTTGLTASQTRDINRSTERIQTIREAGIADKSTGAVGQRHDLARANEIKAINAHIAAVRKLGRAALAESAAQASAQATLYNTIHTGMAKANYNTGANTTQEIAQLAGWQSKLEALFKGSKMPSAVRTLDNHLKGLIAQVTKRRGDLTQAANDMLAAYGMIDGAEQGESTHLRVVGQKLADAWRDADGNIPEAIQSTIDKLNAKADGIETAMKATRTALGTFNANDSNIQKSLDDMATVRDQLDAAWVGIAMSADAANLRQALLDNIQALTDKRNGMVAAATSIASGFADVRDKTDNTAASLKATASAMTAAFGDAIPANIQDLADKLNSKADAINSAVNSVVSGLKGLNPRDDAKLADTIKSASDLRDSLEAAFSGVDMSPAAAQLMQQVRDVIAIATDRQNALAYARRALFDQGAALASGIHDGIKSNTSPLADAAKAMAQAIQDSFKNVEGGVDAASQALIDQLNAKAAAVQNFRDTFAGNLAQQFDVVGMFGTSGASASGVVRTLQHNIDTMRMWADGVRMLAQQGLNPDMLRQIIQGGPATYPLVKGLLQGGPGSISDINALLSQAATMQQNMLTQFENQQFGGANAASLTNYGTNGGTTSIQVDQTIHTQQIDPRQNAADLAWEFARQVS